ncbi:MAG: hypothetical protein RL240_4325 [Planctomycetota bacterium]
MICYFCKKEIKHPPEFWQQRVAPWSCSHCGGLFGVRCNGSAYPIPEDFRPLAPLLPQKVARRFCFYSQPCNYVYALCYPTGIPFYVGVGVRDRALDHVLETRRYACSEGFPSEKNAEIAHLLESGQGVWYHFLALTADRSLAESTESFWIHHWQRRSQGGMLTNQHYPEPPPELSGLYPPAIPEDLEEPGQKIMVWQHPDIVVCPPSVAEFDKGVYPTDSVECCACGVFGHISKDMIGKHLICSSCGHYIYGMDFRERFPLKMFLHDEKIWTYRRRPPADW